MGRSIAIVAPFSPADGGMAQLGRNLSTCLRGDGHAVHQIDNQGGLLGLMGLYLRVAKGARKVEVLKIIAGSGRALWAKDLPSILLAKFMGKVVILLFVGGGAEETARSWSWWKRAPFRLADKVVVPTQSFRDALTSAGIRADYTVIPHVVDVAAFHAERSETGPPVLFAAKKFEPYAGYDLLVEVFGKVRQTVNNAELWIAGDGPERGKIQQLVDQAKLKGVRFLGSVSHDQMPDLMGRAHAFVHCTRVESQSIAIVEAMAAGLPPVAFSVGGIPDVVNDGVTGFLVSFGDTHAFSERVIELIKNEKKWKEMSAMAAKASNQFRWDAIGDQWRHLLNGL